jgi:hypothetical protein
MSAVHPVGGEALTSKVSSALHHVWDAIHPHSTGGAKVLEPCALATEVLSRVKAEMPEWGPAEEEFVDAACLQRYLRARGKDVG